MPSDDTGSNLSQLSVWLRTPPARRSSKAPGGLNLAGIISTAIEMLDEAGMERFSMRKLAARLKVTPMSVYWYVDSREDLLELVVDEVMCQVGIPALPEGEPDPDRADEQWPALLRVVCRGWREALVAHPWAARAIGPFANLGPNAKRFSVSCIAIIQLTGLPPEQQGAALGLVSNFVFGFATNEALWSDYAKQTGMGEAELFVTASAAVAEAEPEFQRFADALQADAQVDLPAIYDRQFELGLDYAIAGIHAMINAINLVKQTEQRDLAQT